VLLCRVVQKLSGQQFDVRDVSAHLQDRVVLFGLFVVERVGVRAPHVLLPDDPGSDSAIPQDVGQRADVGERVEVILGLVQSVHAVLVRRHPSQQRRTATIAIFNRFEQFRDLPWGATAHRGVSVVENQTFLGQRVQIRRLADLVPVHSHFEAPIVGLNNFRSNFAPPP
jgi:hypothetical protein